MKLIKKVIKTVLVLLVGTIMALVMMEVFLRIYNPVESRVRGQKIVLPVNKKYVIKMKNPEKGPPKFDDKIIHTKNSLGFRGEELPTEFDKYLTILTVGGSTTECTYLSDGKTWTDVLGKKLQNNFKDIWINNAGLDGQSTFGHIILMNDYIVKLRPDIVLFLVGANDQAREEAGEYDKENLTDSIMFGSLKGFIKSMANHSEVVSLGVNLYRYVEANIIGVNHAFTDFSFIGETDCCSLTIQEEEFQKKVLQIHKNNYLKGYKDRLEALVRISRDNNIEPVLITQPTLYGNFIYEVSGKEVTHGKYMRETLELYNNVTRQIGMDHNILVIDLSKEMPSNTMYYYDYYHFTNKGAEKVAEIIYNKLYPFLIEKYKYSLKEEDLG